MKTKVSTKENVDLISSVLDWNMLVDGQFFISDLGESRAFVYQGQTVSGLPRYAVWKPAENSGKHQLVEVSHNLDYLKNKYKVKNDLLFVIIRNSSDNKVKSNN